MDIAIIAYNPYESCVPLGDWQLARALAGLGHRVLYVDPAVSFMRLFDRRRLRLTGDPKRHAPRLWSATPFVLSGSRPWLLTRLQRRLAERDVATALKRLAFADVVILTVNPERGDWASIHRRSLVYWQKDRQWLASGLNRNDWVRAEHQRLLSSADIVTGVTNVIVDDCADLGIRCHLVPNGVDLTFSKIPTSEPDDLWSIPRPRAVFSGAWSDRVDTEVLAEAARSHPGVSFVILGRQFLDVPEHSNVYALGERPYSELPRYLAHCDVGLVCYKVSEFNRASYPLKVLEYASAGLWTVATGARLPDELQPFSIYVDPQDFGVAIEQAASAKSSPDWDLGAFSWDTRARHLLSILRDEISERR